MATVIVSASENQSIFAADSAEAEIRKREAKRHFDEIKRGEGLVSTNSLRIGFHAAELKRKGLFGMLGFESEDEAREAAEIGRSTWYAVQRLAEQFLGVREDLFIGMKQENAKALGDLPESKRMDEAWLRKAGTMSIKDFKAAIDVEMDGKARESDTKETTVSLKLSMPSSRKKAVESGLLEYAKEVGVPGDASRGLELMVAEHTGAVSLLGAITSAVEAIGRAKELKNSDLSAGEILDKVYAELETIIETFHMAVTAVQNLDSEG